MYTVKSHDGDLHEVYDEQGSIADCYSLTDAEAIARALNALPVARQMREALESLQAATSGIYPNTEAWAEITNARTALAAAKGAGI